MNLLELSILTILFWFFQKLADWHDEHWLNFFMWAWTFFWVIWWMIWFYLIQTNEILMINYLALISYWIYKIKIDYLNHAISVIIMLIWIVLSNYSKDSIYYAISLLLSYIAFDIIKHSSLNKNKIINLFYKYRLQFILIPIFFWIYIESIISFIIPLGLLWVIIANKLFNIK